MIIEVNSLLLLTQVMGLEDVYVFDGGEVHLDSNATLGNASAEVREIQLVTLHVQDRGTFQLHTVDKSLQFQMSTTNMTVSCTVVFSLSCCMQITVFSSPAFYGISWNKKVVYENITRSVMKQMTLCSDVSVKSKNIDNVWSCLFYIIACLNFVMHLRQRCIKHIHSYSYTIVEHNSLLTLVRNPMQLQ